MTMTVPVPRRAAPTSIPIIPAPSKEVTLMSTATASRRLFDAAQVHHPHARGLNLLIERVAIALLGWSHERTARRSVSHDEHALRRLEEQARAQRESAAQRHLMMRGH